VTRARGKASADGARQKPPRRAFLRRAVTGTVAVAVVGVAGVDLVAHGKLPGKSELDQLDGTCLVPATTLTGYAAPGPEYSGTFYSAARRTAVGYTIGYPPGHGPGDQLPLVIALHGFDGNHTDALIGLSPAQAVALKVEGGPLPPVALVTVDGGNGYWNPHPGDDPQAMLVSELIPRCRRHGLGAAGRVGLLGISMGGYGAIALAEKYPALAGAVAAISPAIWTSYQQAKSANSGAYASAAAFAAGNAVTHAAALARVPVRLAVGHDDPFSPGVRALAAALPARPGGVPAELAFSHGCHTDSFFTAQEPPSLAFLARHLTS
jgi:enterochelin esterase-like enzyme